MVGEVVEVGEGEEVAQGEVNGAGGGGDLLGDYALERLDDQVLEVVRVGHDGSLLVDHDSCLGA